MNDQDRGRACRALVAGAVGVLLAAGVVMSGVAASAAAGRAMASATAESIGATSATGLTVSVGMTGEGFISFNGNRTPCADSCTEIVKPEHVLIMTAFAGQGYTFAGWTKGCYGMGAQCGITAESAPQVQAQFVRQGNVEVTVSGDGEVTSVPQSIQCGSDAASCVAPFTSTSVVTLTPTPHSGSVFLGWGGACAQYLTNPCQLDGGSPSGVTAMFGPAETPAAGLESLVVNHAQMSVDSSPDDLDPCLSTNPCSASEPAGSVLTLTAGGPFELDPLVPLSQVDWSQGCVGTWPVCQLAIDSPTTVTVGPIPSRVVPGATSSPAYNSHGPISLDLNGHAPDRVNGPRSAGGFPCEVHRNDQGGGCHVGFNVNAGQRITVRAVPASRFREWIGAWCQYSKKPTCTTKVTAANGAPDAVFKY
jgi:Divergent InlB B-repeat domain